MLLDLPLPQHITIEILLKLPFESILSCKLVSKQLKNLINDPKFYKLYHNKSVALQFGRDHLYLLLTRHDVDINITNQQFPPYTMHIIPMIGLKPNYHCGFLDFKLLSGSSNSIACVKTPDNAYLFYNLFTGESYTVEASPNQEKDRIPFWICFGFGYDRYADDYNILEVYKKREFDMDIDPFWVYSFKNRRWKSFYGYPYGSYHRPSFEEACSFNGVLHWVVVTMGQKRVVLTYDLHTRKFGEISLPTAGSSIVEGDKYGTKRVSELDGRLCYVYQTEVGLCAWVMQEYGVRESWTKLLAFDVHRSSSIGRRFEQATPSMLCERRDGGKLVLFTRHPGDPRMFWYDMDTKEIKDVREIYSFRREL